MTKFDFQQGGNSEKESHFQDSCVPYQKNLGGKEKALLSLLYAINIKKGHNKNCDLTFYVCVHF